MAMPNMRYFEIKKLCAFSRVPAVRMEPDGRSKVDLRFSGSPSHKF